MKTTTYNATVTRPHVLRRAAAEFVGTGLLVTVVVGSGIAAQRLSPDDVGLQLLENSLTTALGLTVLILMLGPVSGAHFNPVVSLADWLLGRRAGTGLPLRDLAPYLAAQVLGGIAGTLLAGVMFDTGAALGLALLLVFYPTAARIAGDVVVPTQPETTS